MDWFLRADTSRCPKNFCSNFAGSIVHFLTLSVFCFYFANEILNIFNKRPNFQTNIENQHLGIYVESDISV